MVGRVVVFIFIIFIVIIVNLNDFNNLLNKGEDQYIQRWSGMLATLVLLGIIPATFEDLGVGSFFLIDGVYIILYTYMYVKIKKERKNDKK